MRPTAKWMWRIGVIVVTALIVWFAIPFGPRRAERPVPPVTQSRAVPQSKSTTQSTEWAPEPTGPSVPINLPKTPMTNVPEKAP
jgi:hypothetical protein